MGNHHTTVTGTTFSAKLWHNTWKYLLFAASLAATFKILFFGFDIDEQYAVSMAYRMVRGDRMFLEMWEPHQTSAFFSAAFLWIFVHITGGLSYSVLFLRFIGCLTQLLISIFLYHTFRKISTPNTAFIVAIFYYNTIPKNSAVPDFSNMLLWFSTLMFLCLLHFSYTETADNHITIFWLILSGILTSALILSYPTCLLVVIPVATGIYFVSQQHILRNIACYLSTCFACGAVWLCYFLSHMSFSDFCSGVSAMFSDGSHSDTFCDKIMNNLSYFRDLLPYVILAFFAAWILQNIVKFLLKKKYNYELFLIFAFAIEQLWVWYRMQKRLNFPGILSFFLLFLAFRYHRLYKENTSDKKALHISLYFFGCITSLFLLFASFLASNTQLYEAIGYVTIGILVFFYYYFEKAQIDHLFLKKIVIYSIIGIAILHKGFYIAHLYGHDTVFVTRQKAESGPMAGIYGRYSDGYEYNLRNEILHAYIPDESKVLLVSNKTIAYLQGNYDVCNYSTISTPTIDTQLFTYWNLFSNKIPEYIIWDKIAEGYVAADQSVNERLLSSTELLVDTGDLQIYKVLSDSF